MKKIEYEIGSMAFLSCALPWLLERSSMFIKTAIIGMWEFGFPDEYTNITIDSQKQYKEFFREYVWETVITFPALSENCPITCEEEFLGSPYQIYLYYYDGNFLNVWFKDETLADAFIEHLNQEKVIYLPKEQTGRLSNEDRKNFSLW